MDCLDCGGVCMSGFLLVPILVLPSDAIRRYGVRFRFS